MCTSIISNRKKTIVGWNLDILDMEHRVSVSDAGVFIEINDAAEMTVYWCENRQWDQVQKKQFSFSRE